MGGFILPVGIERGIFAELALVSHPRVGGLTGVPAVKELVGVGVGGGGQTRQPAIRVRLLGSRCHAAAVGVEGDGIGGRSRVGQRLKLEESKLSLSCSKPPFVSAFRRVQVG